MRDALGKSKAAEPICSTPAVLKAAHRREPRAWRVLGPARTADQGRARAWAR